MTYILFIGLWAEKVKYIKKKDITVRTHFVRKKHFVLIFVSIYIIIMYTIACF